MTKAKKIETFYDRYSNIVTYEYRGHTYDVEYATASTYCVTSPKIQHEDAQRKIDKMIEQEANKVDTKPFNMDDFFNMLGWD